ncbi:glycosyltransferase family 4 protein [bacterium]|nr:glycosyltransferase family 4 protein [bacterium]
MLQNKIFLLRSSLDINGPGRLVLATAFELKKMNLVPIVITNSASECTDMFKKYDMQIEIIRNNPFFMFFDILRLILRFKPVVYHSFSYSMAICGDVFCWLNFFSKSFFTINGFGSEWILKYLRKTIIIVPSIFMKNRTKKITGLESELIYPCTPEMYLKLDEKKPKTNFEKNQLVIGTLVRDLEVKGIPFFLQTLAMLKAKGIKVKGIVGGCEDKKYLKLIHEFGIDDTVDFLGVVSNVSEFFSKIDVYTQFSLIESFGISVLEAMKYGIPVVLPRIDAFEELVEEDKTGLLFDCCNCTDAVDKIIQLHNNEELYNAMRDSAKWRAWNKFGPTVFSSSLKQVYGLLPS